MVNSVVLNVTFDQDILALSQHHLALHQHPTLACGNNRLRQQARTDKLIIQDRSRQPPIDVYGSIKPVFKDVYLDVLYQSVYLTWMQCASLVNTIKPSLRKQRRKGYLFSTNLCFYAHFYRHAKLYLVYFLANFQTAGTSRCLGAPLVETPSSQFNRNTVYLTETGLIYDCVKVLMWKSLSCFYVCPC